MAQEQKDAWDSLFSEESPSTTQQQEPTSTDAWSQLFPEKTTPAITSPPDKTQSSDAWDQLFTEKATPSPSPQAIAIRESMGKPLVEHLPPPTPTQPPTAINPPAGDAGAVSSEKSLISKGWDAYKSGVTRLTNAIIEGQIPVPTAFDPTGLSGKLIQKYSPDIIKRGESAFAKRALPFDLYKGRPGEKPAETFPEKAYEFAGGALGEAAGFISLGGPISKIVQKIPLMQKIAEVSSIASKIGDKPTEIIANTVLSVASNLPTFIAHGQIYKPPESDINERTKSLQIDSINGMLFGFMPLLNFLGKAGKVIEWPAVFSLGMFGDLGTDKNMTNQDRIINGVALTIFHGAGKFGNIEAGKKNAQAALRDIGYKPEEATRITEEVAAKVPTTTPEVPIRPSATVEELLRAGEPGKPVAEKAPIPFEGRAVEPTPPSVPTEGTPVTAAKAIEQQLSPRAILEQGQKAMEAEKLKSYSELRKEAESLGVDVSKVTQRKDLEAAVEDRRRSDDLEIPQEPSPANDSAEIPGYAPRTGKESQVSLGKKTSKADETPEGVRERLETKSPSLRGEDLTSYAQGEVSKNLVKARDRAMGEEVSPEAFEIGRLLRDKARAEGDFDAEVEITNRIAEKAKIGGQASNFIKNWYNGLSPDGFLAMVRKDAKNIGYSLTDDQMKLVKESKMRIDAMPEGDAKDLARQQLIKQVVDMTPRTKRFLNGFMMYRLNNALSSPRSTLRNVWSNTFQSLITRPISLLGESIAYRDRKAASDAMKWWGDMGGVWGDAVQNYKDAMRSPDIGKWTDVEAAQTALSAERQGRVPGLFTGFLRFMNAQDKFFSTFIEQGEKVRLMRNGVEEAQATQMAKALAEKYLFRESLSSPQGKAVEAKAAAAVRGMGLMFEQMNKIPIVGPGLAKPLMLFVRTPTNVARFMVESNVTGIKGKRDYSKLSPKDLYLHKEQVGRAVAGSILTSIGGLFAMTGNTAWMPPKDEKEKEIWYATGRKPYSIRIGNSWVPMWYFGPYALAFAIPASIADQYRDNPNKMAKTDLEKIGGIALGLTRFLGSQTSTAGAANVLQVLEGRDPSLGKALGFASTQYIPFSGLVRYVNSIVDPNFRKSKTFAESIQKDIPGLSMSLDKYMTPEGKPSIRTLSDYVAPWTIGTETESYEQKLQKRQLESAKKQIENKKKQEKKR